MTSREDHCDLDAAGVARKLGHGLADATARARRGPRRPDPPRPGRGGVDRRARTNGATELRDAQARARDRRPQHAAVPQRGGHGVAASPRATGRQGAMTGRRSPPSRSQATSASRCTSSASTSPIRTTRSRTSGSARGGGRTPQRVGPERGRQGRDATGDPGDARGVPPTHRPGGSEVPGRGGDDVVGAARARDRTAAPDGRAPPTSSRDGLRLRQRRGVEH